MGLLSTGLLSSSNEHAIPRIDECCRLVALVKRVADPEIYEVVENASAKDLAQQDSGRRSAPRSPNSPADSAVLLVF